MEFYDIIKSKKLSEMKWERSMVYEMDCSFILLFVFVVMWDWGA